MAISRYWRLVGISTSGNGPLELSELRLYENGVLADAGATLSCTFAPTGGALADLRDGSALGAVSWPYASYSTSGFALVWDFGAGGDVDVTGLQLGAGVNESTFVQGFTLQFSGDGSSWVTYSSSYSVAQVAYPGAASLLDSPLTVDIYKPSVSLLLALDGLEGSTTLIDASDNNFLVTCNGGAHLSTAQSKFGGSSVSFNGGGDYLSVPHSNSFVFGDGLFTLEVHAQFTTFASVQPIIAKWGNATSDISPALNAFILYVASSTSIFFAFRDTTVAYRSAEFTVPVLATGVFYHIAVVRFPGGIFRLFIDGTQQGADVTLNYPMSSSGQQPLLIGYFYAGAAFGMSGYLDNVRITKWVARYETNFTPPAAPYPLYFLVLTGDAIAQVRTNPVFTEHLLPTAQLPSTSAQVHPREHTFFDAYHGGIGIITGTVKEQLLPKDSPPVPLYRRVLLVDERSQMAIRETWSDAITGDYEFCGVKQGVKYSVISYDHLHNYRAVIADNQDAT